MQSPGPYVQTYSSVCRLTKATEALHQGASGQYIIELLVTVNPLHYMAVVTVLHFMEAELQSTWIARVCLS